LICGCLDNRIGDDGARALAEALKANSTLTTLDLNRACCLIPPSVVVICYIRMIYGCLDNSIGDNGARALAEALKANSTLTNLDLSCAYCPIPVPLL